MAPKAAKAAKNTKNLESQNHRSMVDFTVQPWSRRQTQRLMAVRLTLGLVAVGRDDAPTALVPFTAPGRSGRREGSAVNLPST